MEVEVVEPLVERETEANSGASPCCPAPATSGGAGRNATGIGLLVTCSGGLLTGSSGTSARSTVSTAGSGALSSGKTLLTGTGSPLIRDHQKRPWVLVALVLTSR